VPRAIRIAILALGGQGGGVLADWIVALGERSGFLAQATSVPGVAQRTGSTVYYVEFFPEAEAKKPPVLALMPVPGDVDIVIAAEAMEAGRAVLRGFVSEQTTLIASTHRILAIAEKIAPGDARRDAEEVLAEAEARAGRAVFADMQAAAERTGSVISAPLFGALAASGALSISRSAFEETIRASRVAVESNLAGFAEGFAAVAAVGECNTPAHARESGHPEKDWVPACAGTNGKRSSQEDKAVRRLMTRLHTDFPAEAGAVLREGVSRLIDYQHTNYAALYLDRVKPIAALDRADRNWRLTRETARYLALRMTYEDSIRVAQLKTRRSRFERVRGDVRAAPDQIVSVAEYLHPRLEEFCDILPAPLGRFILRNGAARRLFGVFFRGGRRIRTTSLRGFLPLYALAALRPLRPISLRAAVEKERIEAWLGLIARHASANYDLGSEVAGLARLLKGYGETHERSLRKYDLIVSRLDDIAGASDPAQVLRNLKEAALADEEGKALDTALARLATAPDLNGASARFSPAENREAISS
jgi:indolepyruvate ferredoxin oxidoreductase beta subunit